MHRQQFLNVLLNFGKQSSILLYFVSRLSSYILDYDKGDNTAILSGSHRGEGT